MRFKSIMTAGAVALMAGSLAACSSGSGGSASADGDALKIGIAIPAGNETFWTGWQAGAQEEADRLGVDVTFTDAKGDANTMNDQVNTMIVSGVDGIALASVDPTANKAAVQAATDASIPLITTNRTVDVDYGGVGGANPIVHSGFNDVELGLNQAELIKQACADLDPCNVIVELGTLGSSPQVQRSEGLAEGLAGSPNIVIVDQQSNNFDPTKAVELTQSLLQAHPDAKVLAFQGDPEAVAAITVLREQGLEGTVSIVGLGGSKDGAQAIADGEMFGAPQVSARKDGAAAVDTLVSVIKGDSVETQDDNGIPTVLVPSTLLTRENAADHPGDW